jgi:hypothetical protein
MNIYYGMEAKMGMNIDASGTNLPGSEGMRGPLVNRKKLETGDGLSGIGTKSQDETQRSQMESMKGRTKTDLGSFDVRSNRPTIARPGPVQASKDSSMDRLMDGFMDAFSTATKQQVVDKQSLILANAGLGNVQQDIQANPLQPGSNLAAVNVFTEGVSQIMASLDNIQGNIDKTVAGWKGQPSMTDVGKMAGFDAKALAASIPFPGDEQTQGSTGTTDTTSSAGTTTGTAGAQTSSTETKTVSKELEDIQNKATSLQGKAESVGVMLVKSRQAIRKASSGGDMESTFKLLRAVLAEVKSLFKKTDDLKKAIDNTEVNDAEDLGLIILMQAQVNGIMKKLKGLGKQINEITTKLLVDGLKNEDYMKMVEQILKIMQALIDNVSKTGAIARDVRTQGKKGKTTDDKGATKGATAADATAGGGRLRRATAGGARLRRAATGTTGPGGPGATTGINAPREIDASSVAASQLAGSVTAILQAMRQVASALTQSGGDEMSKKILQTKNSINNIVAQKEKIAKLMKEAAKKAKMMKIIGGVVVALTSVASVVMTVVSLGTLGPVAVGLTIAVTVVMLGVTVADAVTGFMSKGIQKGFNALANEIAKSGMSPGAAKILLAVIVVVLVVILLVATKGGGGKVAGEGAKVVGKEVGEEAAKSAAKAGSTAATASAAAGAGTSAAVQTAEQAIVSVVKKTLMTTIKDELMGRTGKMLMKMLVQMITTQLISGSNAFGVIGEESAKAGGASDKDAKIIGMVTQTVGSLGIAGANMKSIANLSKTGAASTEEIISNFGKYAEQAAQFTTAGAGITQGTSGAIINKQKAENAVKQGDANASLAQSQTKIDINEKARKQTQATTGDLMEFMSAITRSIVSIINSNRAALNAASQSGIPS